MRYALGVSPHTGWAACVVVGGSLVAWKRGEVGRELEAAGRAIAALGGGDIGVLDVAVAGLDQHRLIVATRTSPSVPDRFPRDPGRRRRQPW